MSKSIREMGWDELVPGAALYTFDGNIDYNFNDVVENPYGWWYVEHGKVRFDFNGVAQNLYGDWLIKNGKVDFSNKNLE